jgi:hypothetical protein
LGNLPEIVSWAMPCFEARCDYLLATALTPFAYREELRHRCQAPFISHYIEGWRRMNDALKSDAKVKVSRVPAPAATHRMIGRLMRLARERGICAVVVAMPISDSYDLDPGLLKCIHDEGADLIDARRIDGLTPDRFIADRWHMTQEGADIFADFVGKRLPAVVAEQRKRSRW